MRYTRSLLHSLEKQVHQHNYQLRYATGSFQHGICQLKDKQILVINRFVSIEAKIDILLHFLESK